MAGLKFGRAAGPFHRQCLIKKVLIEATDKIYRCCFFFRVVFLLFHHPETAERTMSYYGLNSSFGFNASYSGGMPLVNTVRSKAERKARGGVAEWFFFFFFFASDLRNPNRCRRPWVAGSCPLASVPAGAW